MKKASNTQIASAAIGLAKKAFALIGRPPPSELQDADMYLRQSIDDSASRAIFRDAHRVRSVDPVDRDHGSALAAASHAIEACGTQYPKECLIDCLGIVYRLYGRHGKVLETATYRDLVNNAESLYDVLARHGVYIDTY